MYAWVVCVFVYIGIITVTYRIYIVKEINDIIYYIV